MSPAGSGRTTIEAIGQTDIGPRPVPQESAGRSTVSRLVL
ncbi:SURF1 family protein, partial [Mesorhizobium sp. M00.F.Ca.ET.158.01.1.1]